MQDSFFSPAGVTSHESCVSQHYRDVNITFVIRLQSVSLTSDSPLDERDATDELKQPSAISSSLSLPLYISVPPPPLLYNSPLDDGLLINNRQVEVQSD